ncbi:MAG: HAD hydrolase-like protein [Thiohalocapsa sp.]|nr:HAD hydrolase-like protein [Thiohalocapsa sp.]
MNARRGLPSTRFRVAIFDFDGTLGDSFPWFSVAINEAAARHGFRRVEAGERDLLRRLGAGEILRALDVPTWKLPMIAEDLRRCMARDIDAIALFEGVGDMLRRLQRAGIALGVVSSNAERNVVRVLGDAHARSIRHLHCGASIFGKASRLRRVLRDSGEAPERVIYIGDELRDIEAARRLGIAAGAVAWGYNSLEVLERAAPDLIFRRVADIVPALLAGAERR